MFKAIINPEAQIPEDVFDSLYILQVRKSLSDDRTVSKKEVIDHLQNDGIDPIKFSSSYLLLA